MFCSLFLVWYAHKAKWIFAVSTVVFLGTAGIIKCYTAFIPGLIIVIVLLFSLLFKLRKKHKVIFACSLGLIVFALGISLVLIYTPSVREHSAILTSLYTNINSIGTSEVLSRTKLWDYCLSLVHGPFTMIGETDVVANSQLTMIEQMAGDATYNDFHSAFVSFYSGYGLAGLLLYLSMFAFTLKGIQKIRAHDSYTWLVTLVLFIGAILFTMPETYTLFVNMSASVFPINLLFIVFPRFLSEEPAHTRGKTEQESYAS
jgi:O-antigen ligase